MKLETKRVEILISRNKNVKSNLKDNIAFQQIFSRVDCTIQSSKILMIVEEVFFVILYVRCICNIVY